MDLVKEMRQEISWISQLAKTHLRGSGHTAAVSDNITDTYNKWT